LIDACRKTVSRCWMESQKDVWDIPSGSHAGLLLSRFLRTVDNDGKAKRDLFRQCLGLFRAPNGAFDDIKALYEIAYKRWAEFIKPFKVLDLAVDGRLIAGLGIENVLEAGIALHHTYGIPYIPGSALKGVASHYCHHVWGKQNEEYRAEEVKDTDNKGNHFKRQGWIHKVIFGQTEESGHITFHDAWIQPDSLEDCLVLDVMTAHHTEYYKSQSKSGADPPADCDAPIPVTFISVKGKFTLALSGDIKDDNVNTDWIDLTAELVRQALRFEGVGGKTSSGYGRLIGTEEITEIGSISNSTSDQTETRVSNTRIDKAPTEAKDKRSAAQRIKDTKKKTGKKGFNF
jgi:CRISPR-associated protein Cmr6